MTKDEFLNRIEATGISLAELQSGSQKAEIVALKRLCAYYLHEQQYSDAEIASEIGVSRSRTAELRAEVEQASEKSKRLMAQLFWRIFEPDDFS
jgi:effector-binding domain-containing protein